MVDGLGEEEGGHHVVDVPRLPRMRAQTKRREPALPPQAIQHVQVAPIRGYIYIYIYICVYSSTSHIYTYT